MPLVDLILSIEAAEVPGDVRRFLQEADRRIEEFLSARTIPGFVPSDFTRAYAVLRALAAQDVGAGNLFCEWGSGFGVVACLAAMLDFDAWGIEIEGQLVDAARQLAKDFDLPVEFIHGSFIPSGSDDCLGSGKEFAWMTTDAANAGEEMDPAAFDVVFAYPWPDEEAVVAALFERHSSPGAILATYHGGEELRLRRKTTARKHARRTNDQDAAKRKRGSHR
jgi:hypothetical protein